VTFHQIPSKFLPYDDSGVFISVPCYTPTLQMKAGENQYKCLIPIYVFPEMKLCSLLISKREFLCSVSQFQHSYVFERFIYFQDRSV
jgi:hypothetical protein